MQLGVVVTEDENTRHMQLVYSNGEISLQIYMGNSDTVMRNVSVICQQLRETARECAGKTGKPKLHVVKSIPDMLPPVPDPAA